MSMCQVTLAVAVGLLFLSGEPLRAQQHTLTVGTCQADAAQWGDLQLRTQYNKAQVNQLTNGTRNQTEIAQLRVTEVIERAIEMRDCIKVDAEHAHQYTDIAAFYGCVKSDRLQAFIERHGLVAQFAQEDAKGLR
jgi:CelD/BcsL family acetyltransferase involved in cellulose biosynthesis